MTELQPSSKKFFLFFGGAVLMGLGMALGAFLFSDPGRSVGVGDDTSGKSKLAGAVSNTFSDILGLEKGRHPVLEIDLKSEETEPVLGKMEAASVTAKSKPAIQEEETEVPDCEFNSPRFRQGQAASAASRGVIFNEIAWMGTETNANDEWLELKNISGSETDLSGWQLLSQDGRINFRFPDAVLRPGGFFLLERTDDEALPQIKADAVYAGLLPNGGSWLQLFDSGCGLADEINASGGWSGFGGDRVARKTLERNSGDLGWHTSSVIGGTPRAENSLLTPNSAEAGGAAPTQAAPLSQPQPPPVAAVAGKININTAELEELDKITGVGPVIAQRIIDYRKANGPFQKLEDLKNVNGIGDKTFEKMRDEITL